MYRMGKEEVDAVARVIYSKKLFKVNDGANQEVANFEKEMREKMCIKHAVLMTSGFGALQAALVGMNIGPGDEVIVPAYTYIATAMAVVSVGAMPVVAEIDDSLMIDPYDIEKKITPKTKAVIPVHMGGYPCDMDAIMAVAKKHNIKVLEDACQAVGGSYKGKRLSTIGDAGAFSFNYFKNISAGEGGALMTNDKEIFENGLIFHDSCAIAYFGDQMSGFSAEPFCGTEMRTNEITAAIMRVQLTRLDGILDDLRKNKKKLMALLAPYTEFVVSNDPEGECSCKITLKFDSKQKALDFKEKMPSASIPAYLGKHVYNDWKMIIEKRGARNPRMNPFLFEENRGFEFPVDACEKSLEILAKHAHIEINPDWTEEDIKAKADEIIAALKQ
ncbi:MAG: DegT/DnrJ/EryC1/StrS family aminotransferase [Ruminococcaceae bacterium]|nr:DegT/DnrJ/EryC1/StrS family aminotransferase [Oscillospiraceae bacterium]